MNTFLDDAVFETPGFAARHFEKQVGQIDAAAGELADSPWAGLLEAADATGEAAAASVGQRAAEAEEEAAERTGLEARRRARDAEELSRRASRRARTETLDLGLALVAAWLRDLAATGEGAPELALTCDRLAELESLAGGVDPRRARRAAELVMDTRRRLGVNVSETLALEALAYRLEFLLGH
ncbi:MAG: hypothetical protein GEU88_18060 [Solirubrobacterales bacterium]|nr:hypothetical protein [Solirubrobacterales bacterium]